MADKALSALTAATALASGDLLYTELSGGNSRKITAGNAARSLAQLSNWALAGTGQTATGVYDFAVDGAKADIDFTGLSAYNELIVIARGLSDGTTGTRLLRVSVDNGSSFYASAGDYKFVGTDGVESNSSAFAGHSTSSTAARSLLAHIVNMKGTEKICIHSGATSGTMEVFTASTSDINAIRITNSGGGNFTAGTVRVLAR